MQEVTWAGAWRNGEVAAWPGTWPKTFARESPSPPPMKLSRNRLPRAQDQKCMSPATSFFGRVSIATHKCQTLTEVHGFVVGQI